MLAAILKTLKWLVLGIVVIVVVAVGAVLFVAASEPGLQLVWSKAQGYLPDGIAIESIEGRLTGPLEIHGLQVENEGMELGLDRLRLEWTVAALLKGKVHIENLALTGLRYTALASAPPDEPAEPFELPDSIDLPVDVQVDSLTLENANIRTAPEAEPFVIDRVHLLVRANDENWLVRELSASGPLFQVDGGVLVNPRGAYPHDAKLQWVFRPPDMAPMEGVTEVRGNLGKLRLQQSLSAPYNVNGNIELTNVLGELGVNAKLLLADTRLQKIKQGLPAVALDANVSANGDLANLAYQLDAKAQESDFGTALLKTAGRYTGDNVVVERLNLTSPDTPGNLSAQGQVALSDGNAMDLVLRWQKMQWPLTGAPEYSSPEGEFKLIGKLQDYRLNGGMRWVLAGAEQEGRLKLDGTGNTESFALQTLALSGAPGTVNGNADIAWAPALKVRAALNGQGVNPGAIVPDWPGSLNLKARLRAEQKTEGLFAAIETLHIDGRLRDQPLQVDAKGRHAPMKSVLEQLQVVAGETRLQASGNMAGEQVDLTWSLNSSDLSTTVPDVRGQVNAEGRVSGKLDRPRIATTLKAEDLRYQANRIAALDLDANIDASGSQNSSLSLTASQGAFGETQLKALSLTGSGTPAAHELELDLDAADAKVALGLTGGLPASFDRWQFVLERARLAYQELAPWTLASSAKGLVTAEEQNLEQACWRSGDARLCLQGGKTPKLTQASFTLDELAFAYLEPFLSPALDVRGGVSGSGSARLVQGGEPDVEVQLRTSQTVVATRDAEGELVQALDFAPGKIDVQMLGGGLEARADLPLSSGSGGGILANVEVPAGSAALTERPLAGNIQILMNDLESLPLLVPEIERAEGAVRGDLALGGSLSKPQINGEVNLDAPLIAIGGPGLEVKDIALSIVGKGQAISVQLDAKSGGGSLNANGDIDLADAGAMIKLKVSGDKFKVLDTRDARVYASPDLTIDVTPERIDVNGSVAIPKADITPKNLPASNGAVTVSDDQIIVAPGREDDPTPLGRELHARVRVIVGDPKANKVTDFAERGRNYADTVRRIPGDKVRFQGFGLKAIFAGDLLVTQAPGEPALGSGELRIVVGEYKAYGQDLSIQNGQVLFAGGPVSEPALNIRAVRRPRDGILVGVRVRGRLQQPDFTIYSEPSGMTQSEQLSWLVLGRPPGDASAAENSLVTRAALALGAKGGNFLARGIGDRIGVDDIGIESGGADAAGAAFVVGKYLTPKLYVSYGIGLFEPVSTVRLRYILTPRWQLETQSSGTATGGDVIYSIERGD